MERIDEELARVSKAGSIDTTAARVVYRGRVSSYPHKLEEGDDGLKNWTYS